MELFVCPICAQPLIQHQRSLRCDQGHNFDLAREGYVNLLVAQHRGSAAPGDNPQMIAARRRFLDAGHYQPLAQALCAALPAGSGGILDIGCGDGYFTAALSDSGAIVYGIDVSRAAVKTAAKRRAGLNLAVASSARLPFASGSFDLATVVMAPIGRDAARVLRPGGYLCRVSAGEAHLAALKQLLYREVRAHERSALDLDGFEFESTQRVAFEFTVAGDRVADLIAMTPMRYHSAAQSREAAAGVEQLTLAADFHLDLFRRVVR